MSEPKRKPQAIAAIEHALLRHVRTKGVVSRGELAQELDLVQSTIGVYVDRLVRDGFLKETIPATRGLGRPPLLVELNARKGRFIGVDFYAQRLTAVSVDFSQNPLERVQYDLPEPVTMAAVLDQLLNAVNELIAGKPEDILAIGVATPGYVDPVRGLGLEYIHIPDWRNVPVVETLHKRFGLPVFIENNIRALALAEYWFGQGRGLSQFACLSVRAGIGAAIMVDGHLFTGSTHIAGEIGEWRVPKASLPAPDKALDLSSYPTVGELASLTALTRMTGKRMAAGERTRLSLTGSTPSVEELLEAVNANDPLATDLVERAADVHAWIVQQLDRVLDPERILIAGPLTEAATYWERLQDACRSFGMQRLSTKVCRSELGRFGGALGAAALAVQYWRPQR
ncbi:MAG TPA: ROK family protein [Planctomycetaceae bacterium]|nr:ROK family protein [Planctomycetaceae bacterium]